MRAATTVRRASVNKKTGRRPPREDQNSRSLWLDVAELDFDARMNAALSSAELHEARLREEVHRDEGP